MLWDCLYTFQLLFLSLQLQSKKLHETNESTTTLFDENEQFIDSDPTTSNRKSFANGKKKVSFSNNDVYLVPTRAEIIEEHTKDRLWYNAANIASFRTNAFEEVKHCMQNTGILEIRKAFTYLYQPSSADGL